MEDRLILTLDFGTQSVRAVITSPQGEELAFEKKNYSPAYFSPEPNYAEQDPDYYWRCCCECTKKIAAEHQDLLQKVAGITISCFRDSAVILDKNGDVIRPMILWLDQRMAKCEEPLPWYHQALFKLVGKDDAIKWNRQRSASNWIKENEPENWAKVDKYIGISTYFNYRITGKYRDSASSLIGHYPMNFKHRKWYDKPETHMQGQIFSLKKSMLCELVKEGSVLGEVTPKASEESGLPVGLKLYACGSDKSCETLGLGIIDDKMGAVSYGTASTIETTTRKYHESEPFLPGYSSCIPDYFNMDIQIYRGYWMINWFLKEFGGKEFGAINQLDNVNPHLFDEGLKDVPPGCDGLVLQPYWGPTLSRPLAKGAMVGFSDAITQKHFYRAIVEGIAFALKEGFEHFEKVLHHKIGKIRVAGGGAYSDVVCQLTADVFNRPVERVQTVETASLGAGIAGYLAIGTYKTPEEAIKNMIRVKDSFTPNAENVRTYEYLFRNVYLKMYPSLKKTYKNIKDFNLGRAKL